jgi:hypothetical protein
MGHIKKVCVVGVLSCWNVDFGPAINEAGRPDPNAITDSKYVKCSGNLLNYLGLQRLKSGDVVFRETEDGDLIAESGLNFQVSGG